MKKYSFRFLLGMLFCLVVQTAAPVSQYYVLNHAAITAFLAEHGINLDKFMTSLSRRVENMSRDDALNLLESELDRIRQQILSVAQSLSFEHQGQPGSNFLRRLQSSQLNIYTKLSDSQKLALIQNQPELEEGNVGPKVTINLEENDVYTKILNAIARCANYYLDPQLLYNQQATQSLDEIQEDDENNNNNGENRISITIPHLGILIEHIIQDEEPQNIIISSSSNAADIKTTNGAQRFLPMVPLIGGLVREALKPIDYGQPIQQNNQPGNPGSQMQNSSQQNRHIPCWKILHKIIVILILIGVSIIFLLYIFSPNCDCTASFPEIINSTFVNSNKRFD